MTNLNIICCLTFFILFERVININKKTINLIVRDQDVNYLFKQFLEYSGYVVDDFTKPSDALLSFNEKKQDLVLLGLNFSEMDGLTVYKRLKEIDNRVLILIVTSNLSSAEFIQNIFPETKNNILYEPISLKKLKNKVDSMI